MLTPTILASPQQTIVSHLLQREKSGPTTRKWRSRIMGIYDLNMGIYDLNMGIYDLNMGIYDLNMAFV